MALLKLSAPWQIYYKELCALFEKDNEIHIIYDVDDQIINIYVENEAKADALAEMLPEFKYFGSMKITIMIIPANKCNSRRSRGTDIEDIFYKNPIVDDIITIDGVMSNPMTYVIFSKEVVQYYHDNLGDYNGICSTLYQDIAERIFEDHEGIFFCTNKTESAFKIPSWSISTTPAYTTSSCTCVGNCTN